MYQQVCPFLVNNNLIYKLKLMQSNYESGRQLDNFIDPKYSEYSYLPIANSGFSPKSSWNKTGHWTDKQNAKYFAFLNRFADKFSEKEERRHWKVFKSLADFLKTRNPNQCRSHHHKMKKDYGTIEETLNFLKNKHPGLEKRSQKYKIQLQGMDFSDFGNDFNNHQQKIQNKPSINSSYLGMNNFNMEYGQPNMLFQSFMGLKPEDKKGDIALANTGLDYHPAQLDKAPQNENFLPDFSQPPPEDGFGSFGGFPSTGLLGTAYQPDFMNISKNENGAGIFDSPFKGFNTQKIISEERKNKIMQCQYYFTQWMSKMQELMENNPQDNLY